MNNPDAKKQLPEYFEEKPMMKPELQKYSYDSLSGVLQEGKNLGWNEAIEEIRLQRYAAEEGGDLDGVEVLTKLLNKLAKKGII